MNTLCAIRDLYRALGEYEAAFTEANGLGLSEALLLCALEEGPLSAGEIAGRLGLSSPGASKVIGSVEQKGFVVRSIDPADRRRMYFALTAPGRRCLKKMQERNVPLPEGLRTCL